MEKTLLLQGKVPKLQQLFAKNWLQYGGPGYQSRVVAARLSKSVHNPKLSTVFCHPWMTLRLFLVFACQEPLSCHVTCCTKQR